MYEPKKGDIVRYDTAWCTPGERNCLFVVTEVHDTGIAIIRWINTDMVLKPTERVAWEMIRPVGVNVA